MTVSCDSCKMFLKRLPTWTLEAARQKERFARCDVCVSNYLSRRAYARHFRIMYFKTGSLQSVKTPCLTRHISHIATSKMRGDVICAQKEKERKGRERGAIQTHFKTPLMVVSIWGDRALMISSEPAFCIFSEDTDEMTR